MACTGLRDSTADTVRPLPMCQNCAHWRQLSGAVIRPHAIVEIRDGLALLSCTRRVAVAPLPEVA